MKIRTGHVTNSSSSSYLVVTTPEVYEKAIEKLEKWQQEILKEMSFAKEAFVITKWGSGENWNATYYEEWKVPDTEDKGERQEEIDGVFNRYRQLVIKDKNTSFSSEDF